MPFNAASKAHDIETLANERLQNKGSKDEQMSLSAQIGDEWSNLSFRQKHQVFDEIALQRRLYEKAGFVMPEPVFGDDKEGLSGLSFSRPDKKQNECPVDLLVDSFAANHGITTAVQIPPCAGEKGVEYYGVKKP